MLTIRNYTTGYEAKNMVQVDVLHAHEWIAPTRVRRYYRESTGPIYEAALRPQVHARLVFLEQGTSNYVIIPDNGAFDFIKE